MSAALTTTGQEYAAVDRGVGGQTVAAASPLWPSYVADVTAMQPVCVSHVLMNWGANDCKNLPAAATWQAEVLAMIDAASAAWPGVKVYLMRPWRRDYYGEDVSAELDTIAGWIDAVVAARPGVAFLGPDERVWLKGADNGATMTTDGTHYSAAGQIECAAQWYALIGPG